MALMITGVWLHGRGWRRAGNGDEWLFWVKNGVRGKHTMEQAKDIQQDIDAMLPVKINEGLRKWAGE